MEYGLIGGQLGPQLFPPSSMRPSCGYSYELHPLPTEEEAHAFMQAKAFKAINVTIPYKKLVIPYCDELDPATRAIGAVNTVVNRDGRLYGYNTDYAGFGWLARRHERAVHRRRR
ncbi:MAG: shikimate dehydrogenase family protein [Subdoligranulum sp.]